MWRLCVHGFLYSFLLIEISMQINDRICFMASEEICFVTRQKICLVKSSEVISAVHDRPPCTLEGYLEQVC